MNDEPFGPVAPLTHFNTFDEVVERANSLPFGLASYVLDTGATTNPYKLVVMGEDTGAANSIDLSALGLTFTETVTAQDASFEFNAVVRGWPGCTHKPLGCGRTNRLTAMPVWSCPSPRLGTADGSPRTP